MKPVRRSAQIVAVASCLLLVVAHTAMADVRLPRVFGNQMVLQRGLPVKVWGSAAPGEEVTVSLVDKQARTTADAEGKWKVELPALSGGSDPLELKVQGKNTITLRDVLVGEVWVCSGQSNMQWSVNMVNNAKKEIAAANHPQIRLFQVPLVPSGTPAHDVDAYWKACTPDSVPPFSAVAYFFGVHLHKELGVPVGLIETAWGGTRIEPWTPPVGFQSVPALSGFVHQIDKQNAAYKVAEAAAVARHANWLAAAQKAVEASQPIAPPPAWPTHPLASNGTPTGLYNGMVHALVPFAIRGAIWYQGESNLPDGMVYADKMKALINGWRSVWNEGDFPFYFVQLAPYRYGPNDPAALPRMWEAQSSVLSIPNTGMAVTNDISDVKDIHPRNKQDVGKRLALWALAKTYGKEGVTYSGPAYKSMTADGSRIRLTFDHVGGGLTSRDGKPLAWFTVAGDDKKFVKAEAKIEGDAIVVTSSEVEKPAAVRFAWNQEAEPNLCNKDGLPASAFRTDKW